MFTVSGGLSKKYTQIKARETGVYTTEVNDSFGRKVEGWISKMHKKLCISKKQIV